ncbi:MAG TPA: winged helix-turn-helix domain-containing protein [Terriglobales bacterium]|nr:winged helix-turn-helix domain-containing protein [Terriglobales bacterium]
MSAPNASSSTIRFGAFEADLRSGELRKDGAKVKLEGQPFQVLTALLARPGQLVTREELQKGLWPDETFVDFEQGINAAVKRLRVALEDSADQPRFVETLPRRGYRFIAHIENGAQPASSSTQESQLGSTLAAAVSQETPAAQSPLMRRATAARRPILIAVAATLAFVVLFFGLNPGGWRDRLLGRLAQGEITSIAVLPLENLTGDPEQQYFVDGMTESLITELGKISALRVISRTSAMAFKDSKKPLPEIARQLGVDAVLEGAVARNGDRVRVTARVMHLSQERTLWAQSYERDLREISALQSEIVLVVADEIKVKVLNQEQARLTRARPVNPRAYEEFLRGRYLQAKMNPEDMRKALVYFQHALQIDPSYAPAYIGIVDAYTIGGGFQLGVSLKEGVAKMKEAAQKAVALDDTTAAAHYALAKVKYYEWDLPGAEREFQRALELNPGDAQVRRHYGHYLIAVRRHADSIREMQHALALDPLSPLLTTEVGWTYYYARQFPAAIEQSRKALEMERDYPYAQLLLAESYWLQGQFEEAMRSGWPGPYQPEGNRRAKEIYQRAGVQAVRQWVVEEREKGIARGGPLAARTLNHLAAEYAELGDKERAFACLEKAYQERDPWLPMDMAAPRFDPLRSDPRFHNLLRRIGLPL